jgi:cytochrome c oxidase subunit 4
MSEKVHPIRLYVVIYMVLMCLLALTIVLSYVDIGRHQNNSIAIAIAVTKAVLIILFFMHMKYERWITWYFAAAGFLWLCIMLTLTMTDYLTRNHPANSSPKGEPVFLSQE